MSGPMTFIVTSNKGGSGKTPMSINLVLWALSRQPALRVLAIDINHTNQDLFQALSHLSQTGSSQFETAFSLPKTGTAYYQPMGDYLHIVRPRAFQPLSPSQTLEMITRSCEEYAKEKGAPIFTPDMIVLDGNYCFPSYRFSEKMPEGWPPFVFLNIWSITSPHELRMPTDYRTTISEYRAHYNLQSWDSTDFVHVFTLLEKERKVASEMTRLVRMQKPVYSVAGSDDLADLYKRLATDSTSKSTSFSFDQIQREVFTPILSEIDSLVVESPGSYSEDAMNARWIERINVFLSLHKVFPMNLFPLPHYYPFLRKAVVDMILRERVELDTAQRLFGEFYRWIAMFMDRFVRERKQIG